MSSIVRVLILTGLRYALHLVDTVQVTTEKSICLTSGVKSIKDTMFFLNPEAEAETKPVKKAPAAKLAANGNPSPVKNKTAGGKVLRNKTRSAAQEELIQSTAAKIAEHQRELHQRLQAEGLARFSEGGGGLAGKEGKTWKRFQSYKGEVGLPREVENMRVSCSGFFEQTVQLLTLVSDLCRSKGSNNCTSNSRLRRTFPYQHHKKCQQE